VAEPVLEARGLAKSFPGRPGEEAVAALDGVDFAVGRGELLAVVGPSGCGKSTLLNIFAGLELPTAGTVSLEGRSGSLLGRVAYMPQRDLLMPWRTVLDNAALAPQLAGTPLAQARARAATELPRFGLEGFANAWPAQLSGGMRQRTALLRTFLTDREVLLLDEPFVALDALTRQEMQERLLDLRKREERTIVFVTHDVDEAIFLGDRVLRMSRRPGRVEDAVAVELPRPRRLGTADLDPAFLELKRRLEPALRRAEGESR
jgi:NitT/TauT family transport system ATP-binding protein